MWLITTFQSWGRFEKSVVISTTSRPFWLKGTMVKGSNKKGSHGPFCLGELPSKRACHRSKYGTAVAIGSACKKCKEQRCKAHCRCARENKLKGHSLPRGVRGKLVQSTASTTSHAMSKPKDKRKSRPDGKVLAVSVTPQCDF